jgi:FAD/FMN-containing dehydrogenase
MSETISGAVGQAEALQGSLRGQVIHPEHADFESARKVYNGMIDRRPRLIAYCVDAADVIAAVEFARRERIEVAIRGGGHNGGGLGTVEDGLVIDLSAMRNVHVDPHARTARVGGGALLGDLDHATHPFGLAAPVGVASTTGVGGLTLGGGIGNLSRSGGLSIDNLVSADVVLADGSYVTATEDSERALFWALRGGGGNFGVVTSFTFRLQPVSTVFFGPTLWPIERAGEILAWYRDFIGAQPEELNGWFLFLTVPPGPPFPEELHLQKMCAVIWCSTLGRAETDLLLDPVRATQPALEGVGEVPFPLAQAAFDALFPPGLQWYWRGHFVDEISDEAIAVHEQFGNAMPTMLSTMHLYPIDGAASRPARDATAWSHRDANWAMVIAGIDPDPANADVVRDWAVSYSEAVQPLTMGAGYLNFAMQEGQERVQAAYRDNYARLTQVKAEYDPENLFHVNQNIRPA